MLSDYSHTSRVKDVPGRLISSKRQRGKDKLTSINEELGRRRVQRGEQIARAQPKDPNHSFTSAFILPTDTYLVRLCKNNDNNAEKYLSI